ncbi:hypothetical protein BH24CHL4_BH24CHL4_15850 [soil metagenome]
MTEFVNSLWPEAHQRGGKDPFSGCAGTNNACIAQNTPGQGWEEDDPFLWIVKVVLYRPRHIARAVARSHSPSGQNFPRPPFGGLSVEVHWQDAVANRSRPPFRLIQ